MHAARRAMPYTTQPRRRTFSYAVKERRVDRESGGGGRGRVRWREKERKRGGEKDRKTGIQWEREAFSL